MVRTHFFLSHLDLDLHHLDLCIICIHWSAPYPFCLTWIWTFITSISASSVSIGLPLTLSVSPGSGPSSPRSLHHLYPLVSPLPFLSHLDLDLHHLDLCIICIHWSAPYPFPTLELFSDLFSNRDPAAG